MRKAVFILLLFLKLSQGVELYEIAEPDLLEEIRMRAESLTIPSQELKEKIESHEGFYLPPAKESKVYEVDPTYCLEEDIYYMNGDRWEVLYPKGYCFNPIDYIPYEPPPMVVFNPCRKEEREWVLKRHGEAILVSTGCSLRKVREMGLKVYFLTEELVRKLSLEGTVSVIRVDRGRRKIVVEVVDVDSGGKRGSSGEVHREAN